MHVAKRRVSGIRPAEDLIAYDPALCTFDIKYLLGMLESMEVGLELKIVRKQLSTRCVFFYN